MAEETASNLTGKRVSTTFRGLLHLPHSIDSTLEEQKVYDGNGTDTVLSLGGNGTFATIDGSLTVKKDTTTENLNVNQNISLVGGGMINDVSILSSGSSVSLRTLSGLETSKLRIRESSSDFELFFGNPDASDKNLFSIIVKKDSGNNLYIKNDYTSADAAAPLWINRATGEVNIKTLNINKINSTAPPATLPPGQPADSKRNEIPVGMISTYASLGIPTGWFKCDGTQYSTLTYPELFGVIGYNYGGAGNNFNVPSLTGSQEMINNSLVYAIKW